MSQLPLDINMSPDCEELPCNTKMMPIILALLLMTQQDRGKGDPFVEMSGTSDNIGSSSHLIERRKARLACYHYHSAALA